MFRKSCFTIFLCLLMGPAAWAQNSFKSANAPGAIGETGSLYLLDQGIFARPFYNDVFGQTDKQLSGATQLGYTRVWSDSSLEMRTHWLLITPTFKERFGSQSLVAPVGRYADWLEIQGSWAKLIELGGAWTRLQLTLGLGEVGDHGGRKVHRNFHKLIGSSLLGLDYDDQPAGSDLSAGVEFGLIDEVRDFWGIRKESMLNFGIHRSMFMTDLYINQNYVFNIKEDFKAGLEMRLIKQLDSNVYKEKHLEWRFELATGLRYGWYRPSIKYISSYLRDDQVGQLYFDPLAVYFSL